MRLYPNLSKFRLIALTTWITGCVIGFLNAHLIISSQFEPTMMVLCLLLIILLFAIGMAFWILSTDHRASILFERKGIALNLGHASAFVAWHNIAYVGVSQQRDSILSLGSRRLVGITLIDPQPYIQSYEARQPMADSTLARTLWVMQYFLRNNTPPTDDLLLCELNRRYARTGYHILLPEAFFNSHASQFTSLVDHYRAHQFSARQG